ncbi:mutS [Symbiodinium sp. KB8]|nr:mutS [Symbiodinium sp. KB8]
MGEFFEIFWEDAFLAAQLLGINCTTRGTHEGRAVPLAGVPLHAAPTHWARLLEAGKRVAVVEQRGTPRPGTLVERQVTRILTPGTASDVAASGGWPGGAGAGSDGFGSASPGFSYSASSSSSSSPSPLVAAVSPPAPGCSRIGVAWADVTTGQLFLAEAPSWDAVPALLARYPPAEVVLPAPPTSPAEEGVRRLASALHRGAVSGCADARTSWLAERWLAAEGAPSHAPADGATSPGRDAAAPGALSAEQQAEAALRSRLARRCPTPGSLAEEHWAAGLSGPRLRAAVAAAEYVAWTGACGGWGGLPDGPDAGWTADGPLPPALPFDSSLGPPMLVHVDAPGWTGGASARADGEAQGPLEGPGDEPAAGVLAPDSPAGGSPATAGRAAATARALAGGATGAGAVRDWRTSAAWKPPPVVVMDASTLRAMELHRSMAPGARRRAQGSLLHVLDKTGTAGGGRLLAVQGRVVLLTAVRSALSRVGDAERAVRRLALGRSRASVSDLATLRGALFDWESTGPAPSLAASLQAALGLAVDRGDAGSADASPGDAARPAVHEGALRSALASTVGEGASAVTDLLRHLREALVEEVPAAAGATAGVGVLGMSPRMAANRAAAAAAAAAAATARRASEADEAEEETAGGASAASRTGSAGESESTGDGAEDAGSCGNGGWLRRGYLPALDEAYALRDGAAEAVAAAEAEFRALTGVSGVRVKRVGEGGFFVDVPRRFEEASGVAAAVESGALWRVRTLKSSVRFKSRSLLELDRAASEAAERVGRLEGEAFDRLAARIAAAAPEIGVVLTALAVLDVTAGLAFAAQELRLCRPHVLGPGEAKRELGLSCSAAAQRGAGGSGVEEDLGTSLYLEGLRHVVVERGLMDGWGAASGAGSGADAAEGAGSARDGLGGGGGTAGPGSVGSEVGGGGEGAASGSDAWLVSGPGSEARREDRAGASAKSFVPLQVVLRGRVSGASGGAGEGAAASGAGASAAAAGLPFAAPVGSAAASARDVAERMAPAAEALRQEGRQWVLTGPNVAGKSTVLRAAAQAALLAQMGSFVPAEAAVVGACDRVFARVGASDDLARELSTFLVEMEEAAGILRHAGPSSLVVVDELGRGTAAVDGLSIAAAALHDLAAPGIDARTLFATHYHELADMDWERSQSCPACDSVPMRAAATRRLADAMAACDAFRAKEDPTGNGCACAASAVRCRTIAVRLGSPGEAPVFTHHIVPGVAEGSFGLVAAKSAGVPPATVAKAAGLMEALHAER